jgi:hypothetical protein
MKTLQVIVNKDFIGRDKEQAKLIKITHSIRATENLINRHYFDQIITLDDFFEK